MMTCGKLEWKRNQKEIKTINQIQQKEQNQRPLVSCLLFFIHRMYTMVQRNVNFVKNEKFIESVMFFSETQEDIPEWEKELQAELQVKTFLRETSSLCQ